MSKPTLRRPPRSQLASTVLGQFRLIYGAVRNQARGIESACGISGAQIWMLREIGQAPGIGVSDLAARLSIHQSTGSTLVEKLVSAGLIERSRTEEDKRRVGLRLTGRGARCLRRAPGPAEGLLPRALGELPPATLSALSRHLDSVVRRLGVRDERHRHKPLSSL